jgi:hypothetical protein
MGRRAKPFRTKLTRPTIRQEYYDAVRKELCKLNLFNPTKPEHESYSKLVEQLLVDWLKDRLDSTTFQQLPERKAKRL